MDDKSMMQGLLLILIMMAVLGTLSVLKGDETIDCYFHSCFDCMVDLKVVDINGSKFLQNMEHNITIPLVEEEND